VKKALNIPAETSIVGPILRRKVFRSPPNVTAKLREGSIAVRWEDINWPQIKYGRNLLAQESVRHPLGLDNLFQIESSFRHVSLQSHGMRRLPMSELSLESWRLPILDFSTSRSTQLLVFDRCSVVIRHLFDRDTPAIPGGFDFT